MPFHAVASQRLYEQVAEQVAGLISRGEFKPGDRLPPERDLAKLLGVSRPTVREAMIALEIAGLVEVRVGAGTFVVEQAPAPAPPPITPETDSRFGARGASPLELVAARRMIEPEIAAAAARLATADDLAAIRETLVWTRDAFDTPAHRAADRQFHVRIAAATRNGILIALVDELWGEMFSPMFERMGALSGLISQRCSPNVHDNTLSEHEAIYAGLEAHDPAAARAAMDRHLENVETILSEGEAAEVPEPAPVLVGGT